MKSFLNKEAFLDITDSVFVYGDKYFLEYQLRSQTDMGFTLNRFRRTYVESFSKGKIIDFGTGYGDLVVKDTTGRWYGFDILDKTKQRLGKHFDEKWENYRNICLFDVLEHLQNPIKFLSKVAPGSRLFISIPLWSGNWDKIEEIESWKHWKPNQHILYASPKGFEAFMDECGFDIIDKNTIETSLGREDIFTFVFEKHA